MKTMTIVASDRSGWNAVEPALLVALNEGFELNISFSGVCQQQYAAGALKLDSASGLPRGSAAGTS